MEINVRANMILSVHIVSKILGWFRQDFVVILFVFGNLAGAAFSTSKKMWGFGGNILVLDGK